MFIAVEWAERGDLK
jgi:serine/threonine protein kinase